MYETLNTGAENTIVALAIAVRLISFVSFRRYQMWPYTDEELEIINKGAKPTK
jgi:hypothetical protein